MSGYNFCIIIPRGKSGRKALSDILKKYGAGDVCVPQLVTNGEYRGKLVVYTKLYFNKKDLGKISKENLEKEYLDIIVDRVWSL